MMDISVKSVSDLGAAIRARRKELGLTQQQLSRQMGIRQPSISAIENGTATTQIGTILLLLRHLRLHLSISAQGVETKSINLDDIVG